MSESDDESTVHYGLIYLQNHKAYLQTRLDQAHEEARRVMGSYNKLMTLIGDLSGEISSLEASIARLAEQEDADVSQS